MKCNNCSTGHKKFCMNLAPQALIQFFEPCDCKKCNNTIHVPMKFNEDTGEWEIIESPFWDKVMVAQIIPKGWAECK